MCNQCGIFNSSAYGVYTANCLSCFVGVSTATAGFECEICNAGYYLLNGRCEQCQTGCQKCTSNTSCYLCQSP